MESTGSEGFVHTRIAATPRDAIGMTYWFNPPPAPTGRKLAFSRSERSRTFYAKSKKTLPRRTVPSHIVPPKSHITPRKITPPTYTGQHKFQQQFRLTNNEDAVTTRNKVKPVILKQRVNFSKIPLPTQNYDGSTRAVTKASKPAYFPCSTANQITYNKSDLNFQSQNTNMDTLYTNGLSVNFSPCVSCDNYNFIIESQKQIMESQNKIIEDLKSQLNFQRNYSDELKKLIVENCEDLRQALMVQSFSCPNCNCEVELSPQTASPTAMETMCNEKVDQNNNVIQNILIKTAGPEEESSETACIYNSKERTENWIKEQQKLENPRKEIVDHSRNKIIQATKPKKQTRLPCTAVEIATNSMNFTDLENLYSPTNKVQKTKESETNLDLLQELKELRIIDSATKGFLEELQARVRKAQNIFDKHKKSIQKDLDDLDPSNQIKSVTQSLLKFVFWLEKFVDNGIIDIEKFYPANERARNDPNEKYYFETTLMIDKIKRQGIFIPTPYCTNLFKTTGVQYEGDGFWTEFISSHNQNAEVQCDERKWNEFLCQQVKEYQKAFYPSAVTTGSQCDDIFLMDFILNGIENQKAMEWSTLDRESQKSEEAVSAGGDSQVDVENVDTYESIRKAHGFENTMNLGTSASEKFSPTISGKPSQAQELPLSTYDCSSDTQEIFHTHRDFLKQSSTSMYEHEHEIQLCERKSRCSSSSNSTVSNDFSEANKLCTEEEYIPDIEQIKAKFSISETNIANSIERVKNSISQLTIETFDQAKDSGFTCNSKQVPIKSQKSVSDTAIADFKQTSLQSFQLFGGKIKEEEFLLSEVKQLSNELLGAKESKLEKQFQNFKNQDILEASKAASNCPTSSKKLLSSRDRLSNYRSSKVATNTGQRKSKIPKPRQPFISKKNSERIIYPLTVAKNFRRSKLPDRKRSQRVELEFKPITPKMQRQTTTKYESKIPVQSPPLTRFSSPGPLPRTDLKAFNEIGHFPVPTPTPKPVPKNDNKSRSPTAQSTANEPAQRNAILSRPINPNLQSSLFPYSPGPTYLTTEYRSAYRDKGKKIPNSEIPIMPKPSRRAANFPIVPNNQ